jgi:hypothetical protein
MHSLISVLFILINTHQNAFIGAENYLSRIQGSWSSLSLSSEFCSWHGFWNISSRHFYATRAVFIIVLSSAGIHLESEGVVTLLKGMNSILDVPVILYQDVFGTSTYNVTRNICLSDVRFRKNYGFLIVSEDVNGVFKYVETSERLWRPDVSLLILIIQGANENSSDKTVSPVEYLDIFKNLWSRHQTSNVFLVVKFLNKCEDDILYYDPFVEGNVTERGQMYKFTFTEAVDRYSVNGFWNLRGYSLRVSVFPTLITAVGDVVSNTEYKHFRKFRGRDGLVLEELTKHMNFSPVITTPGSLHSFEFSDGQLTGPLKDIANGDVDFAMNSAFMRVFHSVDIEYVTPVTHFGKICVLVPRASRMPLWISLFYCLTLTLWATLFGTYIVSAILWHILRKYSFSRQSQKDIHWSTSLTDVLNIFIPTCFVKIFSFQNQSERIFVASCMFSSIIITCAWQGALFNRLKNPVYYNDIDTLEELDASGLPIFTMEEMLYDIFELIDTPATKKLSKRFRVTTLPDSLDLIQQVASHRNFSLLLSLIQIETVLDTYPINTRLLHCVQECPIVYFFSYMVPKGSPYLKDINTVVGRLYEAGLVCKWYYDTIYETFLPARFQSAGSDVDDPKQKEFSLRDLLTAFVVLLFGFGLGVLVLLIELCLSKYQRLVQNIK